MFTNLEQYWQDYETTALEDYDPEEFYGLEDIKMDYLAGAVAAIRLIQEGSNPTDLLLEAEAAIHELDHA